jgi:transposase
MIRTSKHNLNETNSEKLNNLDKFVKEYRRVAELILTNIWTNGYSWIIKKDGKEILKTFDVKNNLLDHPQFLDYNKFDVETTLSARVLSSLYGQLCGVLGASVEKQRKRLYIKEKLKQEGKVDLRLEKKIKQNIPQKPDLENLNPELSSKCCDWQETNDGEFLGFLRLKCLGIVSAIKLPIKETKQSRKFSSNSWKMKTSFLISPTSIDVRWEKEEPKKKEIGTVVGADQGFKTCLTMSDKQITPKQPTPNPNKFHDLESILKKMSRQRKGSRAFKCSQAHRKNYIHWSLKQLNLTDVKEIRLVEIWNIGFKSSTSRILSHWTNTEIRDCLEQICEEAGVQFTQVPSTYKSQRCSECGMVRKANRKGKVYKCKCGCELDADYNSSLNQVLDLPPISFEFRRLGLNKQGFYWLETGMFDLAGEEIRVPLDPTINKCDRRLSNV